jgi:hypothetical protein
MTEQLTQHLPHIVWVRYLGSKRFVEAFRGSMERAEVEVRRLQKKDKTIADTYLLPVGHDVDKWHQKRLEEDRKNGFAP